MAEKEVPMTDEEEYARYVKERARATTTGAINEVAAEIGKLVGGATRDERGRSRVNGEIIRVLIAHEEACFSSAMKTFESHQVVGPEGKYVTKQVDFAEEDIRFRRERWERSERWLRLALAQILGVEMRE